jgi:hypothetical protein
VIDRGHDPEVVQVGGIRRGIDPFSPLPFENKLRKKKKGMVDECNGDFTTADKLLRHPVPPLLC